MKMSLQIPSEKMLRSHTYTDAMRLDKKMLNFDISVSGGFDEEYKEYEDALERKNLEDMFSLILSGEELTEFNIQKAILPEEWMNPPVTVGDVAINQVIIWLKDAELVKDNVDGEMIYYSELAVLCHLCQKYNMIAHIVHLLLQEQENIMYLFYYLTKVTEFCENVVSLNNKQTCESLDLMSENSSKIQIRVMCIASMFHLAYYDEELMNWLLQEYLVKEKIKELFREEGAKNPSELMYTDEGALLDTVDDEYRSLLIRSVSASLPIEGKYYIYIYIYKY